jgi:aminopeptidase
MSGQTLSELWEKFRVAGEFDYDRFWRMPLVEDDLPQITSSNVDLQNVCNYNIGAKFIFLKLPLEGWSWTYYCSSFYQGFCGGL